MKRIINISIAFFFITIMLVSCHSNDSKEKDKSTNSITKSYSITSIKQQALPTTLRLPAQLNAFEIVDIYPKVNGYVKEMLVDMGSKVKQGQVLMIMEAPEVEQNSISAYEKYNRTQAAYVDSRDNGAVKDAERQCLE